jgi:hypothetical protein
MMAGEFRWHLWPETHRRRIDALKIKLGGRCVSCGETNLNELEFHHPNGKAWRSNRVSRSTRLKKYEQEAEQGLVELLCDDCHNHSEDHPDTCFCPHCRGEF